MLHHPGQGQALESRGDDGDADNDEDEAEVKMLTATTTMIMVTVMMNCFRTLQTAIVAAGDTCKSSTRHVRICWWSTTGMLLGLLSVWSGLARRCAHGFRDFGSVSARFVPALSFSGFDAWALFCTDGLEAWPAVVRCNRRSWHALESRF